MADYQIDPHLRHDFPRRQRWWGHQPGHVPLGRPPWRRPPGGSSPPLRWWRRQTLALARWLERQGPRTWEEEVLVLRVVVAALTLLVLAETGLLVLASR